MTVSWVVNLEIRVKKGDDPAMDDLVDRHVLLTTSDIEERERFVGRLRECWSHGDFHDPVEEEEEDEE